jgi:hypothetical protein
MAEKEIRAKMDELKRRTESIQFPWKRYYVRRKWKHYIDALKWVLDLEEI